MAFVHGRKTFVSLDGNDLSTYTNASEMGFGVDSHDVTHYGDETHLFDAGLKTRSMSVSGTYDDTTSGPRDIIQPIIDARSAVTFIRRAEGTGSGLPEDSISVIVTSYVETNPVAGMVAWSCEMQPAGEMTSGNQS